VLHTRIERKGTENSFSSSAGLITSPPLFFFFVLSVSYIPTQRGEKQAKKGERERDA
jgi:hypothetical protein